MTEYVTRREHDEFVKRMEEEHLRLHEDINELKDIRKETRDLVLATTKMAANVEQMTKKMNDIDERIHGLEQEPGEKAKRFQNALIAAIGTSIGAGIISVVVILIKLFA